MFTYPNINPIALELGPIKIHWYGLMYVTGFFLAWLLGCWRARQPNSGWNKEQVGDLIFYGAVGLIIGARLGYILFYDFADLIANPLIIFKIWQGGMSFHGGLVGVVIAMLLFGRKFDKDFFTVADFIVPFLPLGLAAGRLGNFINGELWGRVTTVSWAMVFPHVDLQPRHPSQIYEMLGEGIFLFIILWFFSWKPKPKMAVSGLFLLAYGIIRISLEFFRQPDPQLGFISLGWMTMGQLLSLPMIIFGISFLYIAYRRQSVNGY